MKKYPQMGIAIDNHCAMEFVDNKYRVLTAKKDRKAYKVFRKKGKVILEEIAKKNEFSLTRELYKK